MNLEELMAKLAEVDARSRSNTHRIDTLTAEQKAVQELAASVKVMAADQQHMKGDLTEVKADVKSLAGRSGRRFDTLVDKLIWLVAGGLVAALLAQLGIG